MATFGTKLTKGQNSRESFYICKNKMEGKISRKGADAKFGQFHRILLDFQQLFC